VKYQNNKAHINRYLVLWYVSEAWAIGR